jgi:sphingomyelin phosphodiesterase
LLKLVDEFGDSSFVNTMTEICQISRKEDKDVCAGAIAREGPIIADQIRAMSLSSKTSDNFCITFMGLCSYPAVDAFTVPFPSAKPAGGRPAPSGQVPIQIVHYSDIHVDPFYVPGSSTNCTKPICCRDYNAADSPGNNSFPAGPNGDHACDAPISLEASMYNAIKQVAPNAAFTMFTGDIVDHAVWNTTQAQNTIDINDAFNRMKVLGDLIYPTVGNHEMSPTNAFPPKAVNSNAQWLYTLLSTDWTEWITPPSSSEEQSFGAYAAVYPGGNLKIISINTNLYYVDNYYLYQEPMEQDPSGQLAWLVTELDASERAGQRVYIIGHTPPGVSDMFHDASNYLDQIINRYEHTIAALFFGHTHVDHFQISYSNYSAQSYRNAVATSYIVPSMTPTSGMPAFRVYDVDPVTFAVLDATTYIADMTSPTFQTTGPVWSTYYSAAGAYGPLVSPPITRPDPKVELSPAFWHNVTVALAAHQTHFNMYYERKSRGWDVGACTGSCMTNEICQLRAARSQNNCVTPTPGINFGKRDLAATAGGHDEHKCGFSVTGGVLRTIATNQDALGHLVSKASNGGP